MNTSTFRTNLKTVLEADQTLSNLNTVVYKYPPGKTAVESVNKPVIGINRVATVTIEDGALASISDQTYLIEGGFSVKAASSSDSDWTSAENTANTVIEQIRALCVSNETFSGIATQTRLSSWSLEPTQENVFVGSWEITVRVVE